MPSILSYVVCLLGIVSGHAQALGAGQDAITIAFQLSHEHSNAHLNRRDLFSRAESVVDSFTTNNTNNNTTTTTNNVSFLGHVGQLGDYFHVAVRSLDQANHVEKLLNSNPQIKWAKRQTKQRRLVKRGLLSTGDARKKFAIKDPLFADQWHLSNETPGQEGNDHNVTGAWAQGVFGKGSTVCFVDDGLDYNSKDLKDNYFAEGSYDYNEHTPDPRPKTYEDRHGTRCAGEVAAVKNDICGVGVAYEAKVSAVRILGGALTETDEAASINYKFHDNHIYSCSWGPTDNGQTMEAPPQIVADAVKNGILNGRNGLGSIFVFASGNGGASGDNCNFDGYTNSIYTITVGAVDRNNQHPEYSERCSANMIVMYSSATVRHDDAIGTTDWQLGDTTGTMCTKSHGGTSAAAPLASGIYALVHSIRPDLTWRDFQHITVRSAVQVNPKDSSWQKTDAGRWYSHDFGYGKLDAGRILDLAHGGKIPHGGGDKSVSLVWNVTPDVLANARFGDLEHVTVTVNIDHQRRGDVNVDLISPHGVVSHLAVTRRADADSSGFKNWTFMSVMDLENPGSTGTVKDVRVRFFGGEVVGKDGVTPTGSGKKKVVVGDEVMTSGGVLTSVLAVATKTASVAEGDGMDTVTPANPGKQESGGGGSWIWSIFLVGLFGGCGFYVYRNKNDLWERFQEWQQHRNFLRDYRNDDIEIRRLGRDNAYGGMSAVGGEDDEFGEFGEGPSEAELEELRKGGYLVDDLLFDSTQSEGI
ncbi:hypothetical protein BCR33DRAFT_856554 [Rhizoclosmatium globosum]|uniref:P/Homo B domain-containing protein n=1 Tax=Rhizoclosmatium globosum TaxID=329046 RepID=A0A1Y2BCC9_9FUNG|nr:hypothetical protein BCR33DRAFT_856554 [Rhizoclosmatium globosum]|eukprot:ORY32479.1 hypothetical protein BCR33DRAFT_856554 [Rhizoclosmatium globosum]